MMATRRDYAEIIREFLKVRGIDVNAKNKDEFTALMCAAFKGHLEIAREFLKVPGIDVNARDLDGGTALTFAKENKDKEMIDLLVEAGVRE